MENWSDVFEKVRREAEEQYQMLDDVLCPYLKTLVGFNAKGLDHIKMKSWNRARVTSDQYLRLKFLKWAPTIITLSHTLQEIKQTRSLERQKINSRWERRMISVTYYGFIAILHDVRVKVIVKEIEGSKPFFWSIIPFWKTRRDPISGEIKKIFHEGDLENQ